MHVAEVKNILGEVLGLGPAAQALKAESALLGNIPELDSMAVVQLISTLEERFGISIDDDEIGARHFATVGSLADFIAQKTAR